jgi:hypothetical protein
MKVNLEVLLRVPFCKAKLLWVRSPLIRGVKIDKLPPQPLTGLLETMKGLRWC